MLYKPIKRKISRVRVNACRCNVADNSHYSARMTACSLSLAATPVCRESGSARCSSMCRN
jgi:hypothetical protein